MQVQFLNSADAETEQETVVFARRKPGGFLPAAKIRLLN
jgi:hypothetical protein